MTPRFFWLFALCASLAATAPAFVAAQSQDDTPWVVYEGAEGPGQGKHIVLVSGDEEYRSEEALTQLARILAFRHGFKTTTLYAVHPESGVIDPEYVHNIPGLHMLEEADLMIIFTRFRDLPEEQMRHIEAFTNSGKPIIGLRTSTHAFRFKDRNNPFIRYDTTSEVPGWEGGWGRQVLGETWISHHGRHAVEGTRGVIHYLYEDDPILNGIGDNVYGDTDVYGLTILPEGTEVLIYGLTLKGLDPYAPPEYGTVHRARRLAPPLDGRDRKRLARLCHYAGRLRGSEKRGGPASVGQCDILGARHGGYDAGRSRRRLHRPVSPHVLWLRKPRNRYLSGRSGHDCRRSCQMGQIIPYP